MLSARPPVPCVWHDVRRVARAQEMPEAPEVTASSHLGVDTLTAFIWQWHRADLAANGDAPDSHAR